MRLYLASTSPARLATLRAAGIEPVAAALGRRRGCRRRRRRRPSTADRDGAAARAAQGRGRGRRRRRRPIDGFILGGDSAFELDGVVYGKPHTPEVARERWHAAARPRRARCTPGTGSSTTAAAIARRRRRGGRRRTHRARSPRHHRRRDRRLHRHRRTARGRRARSRSTASAPRSSPAFDGDPHAVVGLSVPHAARAPARASACAGRRSGTAAL